MNHGSILESQDNSQTSTRLGGQALYLLLGNIFTLVVGFPLQVFVARTLGAESLGIFSLFDGAVSLGVDLCSFGLAPALVKFIPHCLAQNEHAAVRLLVKRGSLMLMVAGTAVVLVVWALVLAKVRITLLASQPLLASIMVLLVPLGLLTYFVQQALRGFLEVRYMVMGTSILQLGVKAVVAVLLLQLGLGLAGYVIAVVVATLCSCLWLAVGLWRKLQSIPSTSATRADGYKKEWRDFALVMYGNSMLGVGATYLDRFLLGWLNGATPVGVLMLLKQLYALPGVFFHMFMAAASPMFSSAHARDDGQERQHLYHLITDWVTRLSAPLCIFLLMFAEPVLALFGNEFAINGRHSLRILVAAQMVNLAMGPLGIMLTLSGREKLFLKLAVVEQVLTMIGLCLLVPNYGLNGAVIMIAYGILQQNAVAYVVARRSLGLRWFEKRYLLWILPGLFSVVTAGLIRWYGASDLGALGLIAILVLLYAIFFTISLLQGLHEDDKHFIAHIGQRLLQYK